MVDSEHSAPPTVLEIAAIRSTDGDRLAEAAAEAIAVLHRAPGCQAAAMRRCVERPDEFALLVSWDSIADHEDFRSSDLFDRFREPIAAFFAEPPTFAHYEAVAVEPPAAG